MADQTQRYLDQLEPRTRFAGYVLISALRNAGAPAVIVANGGLRTYDQQQLLVAQGRSRTLRSKHLEGRAFDIDLLGWNRDNIPAAFWEIVGPWAEKELGLVWGGRWVNPYDPGHFETT